MSKEGGTVYLGLCARIDPPLIGIHYKDRAADEKKKVYTILLQRLILNPNVSEVVDQLYREHPHILKQDKIPKERIANIFAKIQATINEDEYGEQQFQQAQRVEKGQKKKPVHKFEDEQEEQEGNPQLNKSL